jgi:hypothetical protein
MATTTCPACGADLGPVPVGEPCPKCGGQGRALPVEFPDLTTAATAGTVSVLVREALAELDAMSFEQRQEVAARVVQLAGTVAGHTRLTGDLRVVPAQATAEVIERVVAGFECDAEYDPAGATPVPVKVRRALRNPIACKILLGYLTAVVAGVTVNEIERAGRRSEAAGCAPPGIEQLHEEPPPPPPGPLLLEPRLPQGEPLAGPKPKASGDHRGASAVGPPDAQKPGSRGTTVGPERHHRGSTGRAKGSKLR